MQVLGIYFSFDITDHTSTQTNFGYLGSHSDCPTTRMGLEMKIFY